MLRLPAALNPTIPQLARGLWANRWVAMVPFVLAGALVMGLVLGAIGHGTIIVGGRLIMALLGLA